MAEGGGGGGGGGHQHRARDHMLAAAQRCFVLLAAQFSSLCNHTDVAVSLHCQLPLVEAIAALHKGCLWHVNQCRLDRTIPPTFRVHPHAV